jgi:hypothetical protein
VQEQRALHLHWLHCCSTQGHPCCLVNPALDQFLSLLQPSKAQAGSQLQVLWWQLCLGYQPWGVKAREQQMKRSLLNLPGTQDHSHDDAGLGVLDAGAQLKHLLVWQALQPEAPV